MWYRTRARDKRCSSPGDSTSPLQSEALFIEKNASLRDCLSVSYSTHSPVEVDRRVEALATCDQMLETHFGQALSHVVCICNRVSDVTPKRPAFKYQQTKAHRTKQSFKRANKTLIQSVDEERLHIIVALDVSRRNHSVL